MGFRGKIWGWGHSDEAAPKKMRPIIYYISYMIWACGMLGKMSRYRAGEYARNMGLFAPLALG